MAVKRVVVRLTREEKQMLRELAEIEGTSMSEVVRRIIDRAYDDMEATEAHDKAASTIPAEEGVR